MSCNLETPIISAISPKTARLMAMQLERHLEKVLPDGIDQEFRAAIDSLVPIGAKYSNEPQPWVLRLADMRSALTWMLSQCGAPQQARDRFGQPDQQTQNALNELAPMYAEFKRIAQEAARQIIEAGDVEFETFLRDVVPGFMMETECGVDPLQGTIGLCPRP